MNPIVRKGLGVLLGLVAAALASIRFMAGFREGKTNWILPVLIAGILLLIFYSLWDGENRKKKLIYVYFTAGNDTPSQSDLIGVFKFTSHRNSSRNRGYFNV